MKDKDHKNLSKRMKELLPNGWTYGYIGNYWHDGRANPDDRSWRIFPNAVENSRYGTSIGSYNTEEAHKLIDLFESGYVMNFYDRMIKSGEWKEKEKKDEK